MLIALGEQYAVTQYFTNALNESRRFNVLVAFRAEDLAQPIGIGHEDSRRIEKGRVVYQTFVGYRLNPFAMREPRRVTHDSPELAIDE